MRTTDIALLLATGSLLINCGDDGPAGGEGQCPAPVDVEEIGQGCEDYVQLQFECSDVPASDECVSYEESACQYEVDYESRDAGEPCRAAYEDYYACLSRLSCKEFAEETECRNESESLNENCFAPSDD